MALRTENGKVKRRDVCSDSVSILRQADCSRRQPLQHAQFQPSATGIVRY